MHHVDYPNLEGLTTGNRSSRNPVRALFGVVGGSCRVFCRVTKWLFRNGQRRLWHNKIVHTQVHPFQISTTREGIIFGRDAPGTILPLLPAAGTGRAGEQRGGGAKEQRSSGVEKTHVNGCLLAAVSPD
jgi:hypothetical protein